MKPTETIFALLGGWSNLRLMADSLTWSTQPQPCGYYLFRLDFKPVKEQYSRGSFRVTYQITPDGSVYLHETKTILYRRDGTPTPVLENVVGEFWFRGSTPCPENSRLAEIFKTRTGIDLFHFGQ